MASSNKSRKGVTPQEQNSDRVTSDSSSIRQGNPEDVETRLPSLNDGNERQFTPPIGPEAVHYKMNHNRRGKAIIFNHQKFGENLNLTERIGTDADKEILTQSLAKFRFEVEAHDDLKKDEIVKHLEQVSKSNHKDADCLIVAVLTHGEEEGRIFAYDTMYKNEELWNLFTADICPTLAGRPKIFLIQACRGGKISQLVKFNSGIQIDSKTFIPEEKVSRRYSIPVEADILVAFSTYEGRAALRDIKEGTWFIQELCRELDSNGEKLDMLTLLTHVNRHVAVRKEYKACKQMPVIQSTLTRKLFLGTEPEYSEVYSEPVRVATDIYCMLGSANEKLDHITRILETRKSSIPIQKPKTMKKQVPSSEWDSLCLSVQTVEIGLPDSETVIKHGKALKLFLEDKTITLPLLTREEGEFVLSVLSNWDNLRTELRGQVYQKLVIFMNENAKNWKVFELLNFPDISTVRGLDRHRRCSIVSDASDAGSSRRSNIATRHTLPRKHHKSDVA